jgi:hypothetical protein
MRRLCRVCGAPTEGAHCPAHTGPRQPYGAAHRAATAKAVRAEPWCHTSGGCPFPDSGRLTNPLTGGHPLPLTAFHGDRAAWNAQPRVPQCLKCNGSRRPL